MAAQAFYHTATKCCFLMTLQICHLPRTDYKVMHFQTPVRAQGQGERYISPSCIFFHLWAASVTRYSAINGTGRIICLSKIPFFSLLCCLTLNVFVSHTEKRTHTQQQFEREVEKSCTSQCGRGLGLLCWCDKYKIYTVHKYA